MPDVLILVARLILAAVFGIAGWAKLSDRAGTRQAVRDFGVPEALATPVTYLLPLAELIVAALLVFSDSAVMGAIGAAVLLALFIVAIAVSLVRGRQPDCHCFGQVHSKPVGPATLVRNAILVGLAAVIIADGRGGTNLGDWWIAVFAAAVIGAALGRLAGRRARLGRLRSRVARLKAVFGITPKVPGPYHGGLPVGTEAPPFDLGSTAGDRVTLSSLVDIGSPVLLLFTTPECDVCGALLPEVAAWREQLRGALTIAVIGAGLAERNREKAVEYGFDRILVQQRDEVFSAYGFIGTPSAVVVTREGKIGSPLVAGADAVRALARDAASGQLLAK